METAEVESRAAEIFLSAVGRDERDRTAFIESACCGQPQVRSRVVALLAADAAVDSFLEPEPDALPSGDDPMVGRRVGQCTIKRLIGRGGMGSVYEAVQSDPERTVALKIMSPLLSSRESVRRFAHESRALARLRHPGIVQIYHTGSLRSEVGVQEVPYFAMEFVPGARSILRFVVEERPARSRALELFAAVCDAVSHGHAQGVIHRDLKPTNILVDEAGSPKIIDFGVARAVGERHVGTIYTATGQLIGTPSYMSPEQAAGDPDAVDVRTDVYALGAILYELLTGRPPLDLSDAPLTQIPFLIGRTIPERPSSIDRSLQGDLETIVLKALEKDPARRYQSVADLGRDIRNFLEHRPILARPPGTMYLLTKFARRHRAAAAAVAVAATALLAGSALATWQAVRATRAERATSAHLVTAQQQTRKAEATVKFLTDMLTAAARPTGGAELSVRQVLDEAAARLDSGELSGEPEVEDQVRMLLGDTYAALSLLASAVPHYERAVRFRTASGDATPEAVSALTAFAGAYNFVDDRRAGSMLERTLAACRTVYGDDHPKTYDIYLMLGNHYLRTGKFVDAEAALRRAIEGYTRHFGPDSNSVATAKWDLAIVSMAFGRRAEKERLYRQVLERHDRLAPVAMSTIRFRRFYANHMLILEGKLDEAEAFIRETLERARNGIGPNHPETLTGTLALANVMRKIGRLEESLTLVQDILERGERHGWMSDSNRADVMGQWARALAAVGRDREGVEVLRRELSDTPKTLSYKLMDVGEELVRLGRPEVAEPILIESRSIECRTRPDAWTRYWCAVLLGHALLAQDRWTEAEPLLLEGWSGLENRLLRDPTMRPRAAALLVQLYESTGRTDEAARWRKVHAELCHDPSADSEEPPPQAQHPLSTLSAPQ